MLRKVLILMLVMILGLTLTSPSEAKSSIEAVTIKEAIVKHSVKMGMDPALALSIAKLESGFCHEKRNPSGAVGVFQLMPSTAKKLGYNPYYLNENIAGGIKYFKMMHKMFGSVELALAAYNAGPGNVRKYKGIPPFSETKHFVANIINEYNSQKVNPDPVLKHYKDNLKKTEAFEEKNIKSVNSKSINEEQEKFLENFMITQAI